jgi:hypothetical protein
VQVGVLPGTSHSTVLMRPDLILGMLVPFLDAPLPDGA